jgi:hypothetical protein
LENLRAVNPLVSFKSCYHQIARWLYDQNGVESVPAFAKAATFNFYNGVNEAQERIAEQQRATQAQAQAGRY